MIKLEKGQMTRVRVRSQFGWHVIQLDDTRDAKLPPFEELKPQISQQKTQEKLATFQEDLRKAAKVK